jgi:hypothetical protein
MGVANERKITALAAGTLLLSSLSLGGCATSLMDARAGGEFRDDLVAFIDPETVEACVSRGVREVLPVARGVQYFGFTDPSGGSSDSMTLAIGHRAGEKVVIDCLLEQRPPFKPDQCVLEFCAMLRAYGVTSIQSDHYAGAWVTERFAAHSVRCEQSAKPKSGSTSSCFRY